MHFHAITSLVSLLYTKESKIFICFFLCKTKSLLKYIKFHLDEKSSSIHFENLFLIKTKKLRYLAKMIGTINNQYETRIINHSSIKQGLNNPAKYR